MRRLWRLTVLCSILFFMLAACTTNTSGIGAAVIECCDKVPAGKYISFDVEAVDMPAFLSPLMVSNFSVAFANHGLQPMATAGDLHVQLKYDQSNLLDSVDHDDFGDHIAPGGDVRFIARVTVNIYDGQSRELVWSGSLQRLHDVSPGEYMHTGNASVALLQSFSELLASFPKGNKLGSEDEKI